MIVADAIERAMTEAAEAALRRAAMASLAKARAATDGARRDKHERDAATWSACAADVAALKGSRGGDEPEPAPVGPAPDAPADGGTAALVPAERECA